jgi:dTDP-4-amino-4,6-dideoxygalactose transaminase
MTSAFKATPVFKKPRSTSNLVRPNKALFKEVFFESEDIINTFKNKFSELHGTKYCIPVVNGLWAIVIAINELKINGRSEVIMPSLTYRRMADIAAWLGLTPRFCDIDSKTFSVQKENIEKCINEQTAIIIAPHAIVNTCDVQGIEELCREKKIPLIFDSIESYYAEINNKKIGGFGDVECFSLHASKFINGFEGGYITTNNYRIAEKLAVYSNGGVIKSNKIAECGLKLDLPEYHAALAISCLEGLDEQLKHNKEIYKTYKERLANISGLRLIEYSEEEKRTYKNILIEIKQNFPIKRDVLIDLLHSNNILSRPYYYPPLHEMKRDYLVAYDSLPNTTYWRDRLILMPSGYFVTKNDVIKITDLLNSILKKNENEKSKRN